MDQAKLLLRCADGRRSPPRASLSPFVKPQAHEGVRSTRSQFVRCPAPGNIPGGAGWRISSALTPSQVELALSLGQLSSGVCWGKKGRGVEGKWCPREPWVGWSEKAGAPEGPLKFQRSRDLQSSEEFSQARRQAAGSHPSQGRRRIRGPAKVFCWEQEHRGGGRILPLSQER